MHRRVALSTIYAAALAAGLAAAMPAAGQTSDTAQRCRALPTDSERLACMEGALIAAEAALGALRQQPTPPQASAAPPAAPALAEGQEPREGRRFLGIPVPFGGGAERAGAESQPSAEGLGAEQVARRTNTTVERDSPRVRASIVSFREYLPGLLQFDLDNGQVWRQVQGDTRKVVLSPGRPVNVEMWSSWAGGYRLRIVDSDRIVQVERIR